MERRFAERKQQMLAECQVSPQLVEGITERLREFIKPFAAGLSVSKQEEHAQDYIAGLVSDLERKNVESIAYLHDQDRQGLQRFMGVVPWDHKPMLHRLAEQVGVELGESDGVIVFDPSGFPKNGNASVGVARQWLGRLGKVDNGQVGVYMGYVSRCEHTLVDMRLYLPEAWAKDRARRKKAGVPKEVRFHTRHELALQMLDDTGTLLPHGWVTGDDEMGRSSRFRRALRERGERYVLAVPSNTTIRDLEVETTGRRKAPFVAVKTWSDALAEEAWTAIEVCAGEKGPLQLEVAKRRVQARTEGRRVGPEETLVVFRSREGEGWKYDYCLCNAESQTPLAEFARVLTAEHRIEDSIKRAKSQAGLADYEVRTWWGWHHHQALSLLATWFLVLETRRGKKRHSRIDHATGSHPVGTRAAYPLLRRRSRTYPPRLRKTLTTQ